MRQCEGRIPIARQTGKRNSLIGEPNTDKLVCIFTLACEPEDDDLLSIL